MAVTAALLGRSQHALKYRFTAAGGSGSVAILQATLLADAEDGPLKEILNKTYTQGEWDALVAASGSVNTPLSIYAVGQSKTSGTFADLCSASWNEGTKSLTGGIAAADSVMDVEIRVNHTFNR